MNFPIQLIGPGGAGKSTAGALLAEQLRIPFVDIDAQFMATAGDITSYIERHGYEAYSVRNVEVYLSSLTRAAGQTQVLALSSGFMTYPSAIHPRYTACRSDIVKNSSTFLLLPSFNLETCVRETVRRQLSRSFSRSAEREEQVIRSRFDLYRLLPVHTIETMCPLDEVVTRMASRLLTPTAEL